MLGFSNISLSNFLFWATQKRWFLYALGLGALLLFLPTPHNLQLEAKISIIILIVSLILIIKEPIPLPAVAIFILIAQIYGGVDTVDGIAKSFMSDAVFFIMGSLMLAVVIIKQGWDSRIALGILKFTGNKTAGIALGFLSISAVLSSFIGEHTVAAIMLPIGMTLIRFTSTNHSKVKNLSAVILFSIAYGCLIGSVGTPSGGGRNVIMINYLNQAGISISYFDWMLRAYPFIFLQIPIASWIIIKTFKPEHIVLDSSVRKLVIKVARSRAITGRNTLTVLIFIFILSGWVFLSEKFGLGTIALTGVFLYLLGGFVKWSDLNKHTHWGVIILFGATISLGTSISKTGGAMWLADQLIYFLGTYMDSIPFFRELVVIMVTTSMSNVLSSSATVAVLGPINLNLVPEILNIGLLTAISSSFSYFTAVAAPACTIVYSSGMIRAKDFIKIGFRVGMVSILLLIAYVNIYWPLLNHYK